MYLDVTKIKTLDLDFLGFLLSVDTPRFGDIVEPFNTIKKVALINAKIQSMAQIPAGFFKSGGFVSKKVTTESEFIRKFRELN